MKSQGTQSILPQPKQGGVTGADRRRNRDDRPESGKTRNPYTRAGVFAVRLKELSVSGADMGSGPADNKAKGA